MKEMKWFKVKGVCGMVLIVFLDVFNLFFRFIVGFFFNFLYDRFMYMKVGDYRVIYIDYLLC